MLKFLLGVISLAVIVIIQVSCQQTMSYLDNFLDTARSQLENTDKPKVLVLGNDSADLDSIISSLLFSYLSSNNTQSLYIPLVKVPKADLELRPELKYVAEHVGLNYKKLICIDEFNITQYSKKEDTTVVLVDHNHLTFPFDTDMWAQKVVGVLDHHADEKLYLNVPLRVIQTVGSCVTLVLDQFDVQQQNVSWLDETIARLAMAPILIDTVNLQWNLGRTTELDVQVFDVLKGYFNQTGQDSPTQYFKSIEKVKSMINNMSNHDILRRDYKEFSPVNGYRIGTSAVTWNLRDWAKREDSGVVSIVNESYNWIKERSLDLEVIFTQYNYGGDEDNEGDYRRELAIIIANDKLLPLKEALEKNTELQLNPITEFNNTSTNYVEFYDQQNVKVSRKQVWPFLKQQIEGLSAK